MKLLFRPYTASSALRLFDRLMPVTIPLVITSAILSYFVCDITNGGREWILYSLSGALAVGAYVFRRHFSEALRVSLYTTAMLSAGVVSLLCDGLWGQGAVMLVATLLVASMAPRPVRMATLVIVALSTVVISWVHIAGFRSVDFDAVAYDRSVIAWLSAVSTISIFAVWTVIWGHVAGNLDAREREQERLRVNFRRVFKEGNNPMFLVSEGVVVSANDSAHATLGSQTDGLVGTRLATLLVEQGNTAALADLERCLNQAHDGTPVHFPWTRKMRPEQTCYYDVSMFLSPYGDEGTLLVVVRDFSWERQLERDNHMLAMAVEQAGEGIVITDVDGKIEYVNAAFERSSGYDRSEVLGVGVRILKSGRMSEEFYRDLRLALDRGEPWQGRIINRRKSGEHYTEQMSISPLRGAKGEILQYICVKRDISRELRLENQLIQAQKMEAVGHLAGGIAHDFNNMLQVVMGNVEMASTDLPVEHPALEALAEISKASEKSAGLVRQLLAFSRKDEPRMRDAELNELVASMSRMIRRLIGAEIHFEFKPCEETLGVSCDPGQIEQVLVNLCVNSRDAMPGGGNLTVETSLVSLDEHYCRINTQLKPGRYACITVSDNGAGIPPEIQNRIFEPFFTTKEVGKGTGLGLASVYAIVQKHKGAVHLYSEVGIGTTFRIYIPSVACVPPRGAEKAAGDLQVLQGRGETILVGEDDAQVLKVVTRMLEQANYKVIACEDGEQLLDKYAEHRDIVDLVLLDVVMPRCNGRLTYERLQNMDATLPVIFVTGYSFHHLREGWPPAVPTVNKPYNPRDLLETIRRTLASAPSA